MSRAASSRSCAVASLFGQHHRPARHLERLLPVALGPQPQLLVARGLPFVRVSQFPKLALKGPTPNFFDGRTLTGGILYPNFEPGTSLWDSLTKTEAKFGAVPKTSFSPGDLNHQTERTLAAYIAADYEGVLGA